MQRVSNQFEKATMEDITLVQGEVKENYILDHLDKYGPVIILVNNNLLSCLDEDCGNNRL